ncbi:MAG: DNA-directed RNA polymerase subunit beta', partial [Candidatus Dormibacteria bacterium]
LHECGLPKKMALELFKPFVMRELVAQNYTQNIKSAKRMVERVRPEVWDVLDQVIHEHPVLLNRAPTLHRLGIQAFMPVLVEGQAIQIHPLVCTAFNADFDGDQMAVHVPLFSGAVAEAKNLMMSSNNILSASNGFPVVSPTQDVVLGSYYLTQERLPAPADEDGLRRLPHFSTPEEASLAYEHGAIQLHDQIRVRIPAFMVERTPAGELPPEGNAMVTTTVGRVIFNEALPLGDEGTENPYPPLTFYNEVLDSKKLRQLVKDCYDLHGSERTAGIVNEIKRLGFHYATKAGVTISAMDIKTPPAKAGIIAGGEREVEAVDLQFRRGLITDDERYIKTVETWTRITDEVTKATMSSFDKFHSVLMMSQSGARGSVQQIRQLAGMRGLM